MKTGVDTNVLLGVALPAAEHHQWSQSALAAALDDGTVAISEAVYAELASHFRSTQELDGFLDEYSLELEPMGREALHEAGLAWVRYARNRPSGLTCTRCGRSQEVPCTACGSPLRSRQHVLADFLIGAHALFHTDRLLTRDHRVYGTYFPALTLMSVP